MAFIAAGKWYVALQVRPYWNTEKNKRESWPGGHQVTAHGKLKDDEDFIQSLVRETEEEIGYEAASVVQRLAASGELIKLVDHDGEKEHAITFGAVIGNPADVEAVLAGTNRTTKKQVTTLIRLVNEDVEIVDLRQFDKEAGVTNDSIAMFPDEKEAVRLAFEKLG